MVRARGRAPRGERLVAAVPHGHWHTTTFRCGLRADGLVAPFVLDGAITGPAFPAYVEQALAPTLAAGDVVALDNLASHKVKGVREAIEARGVARPHPPPNTPAQHPGELAAGQRQRRLPAAAAPPVGALWNAIGRLLGHFSPAECAAYFRHCGYPQSGR